MTDTVSDAEGYFDLVDIRQIPDEELEDLLGGVLGPMVPQVKTV